MNDSYIKKLYQSAFIMIVIIAILVLTLQADLWLGQLTLSDSLPSLIFGLITAFFLNQSITKQKARLRTWHILEINTIKTKPLLPYFIVPLYGYIFLFDLQIFSNKLTLIKQSLPMNTLYTFVNILILCLLSYSLNTFIAMFSFYSEKGFHQSKILTPYEAIDKYQVIKIKPRRQMKPSSYMLNIRSKAVYLVLKIKENELALLTNRMEPSITLNSK